MAYFVSVFTGTFVLEDVALALALGLVGDGRMSAITAFLACFSGITIGDLALYGVGAAARRWGWSWGRRVRAPHELLTYSIVASRFLPGTRLPTYLAAGYLRYPFIRFTGLTVFTVFGWVALAFAVGESLRPFLLHHVLLTALVVLLSLHVLKSVLPPLLDPWGRRALRHSWRKWRHFEFWPASLFYLPIIPIYLWLSLRYRSLLTPFHANPEIENGGLINESKWDFLRHLDPESPHTLTSLRLDAPTNFMTVRAHLESQGFAYPFVLKPDVGQRGFGVRIIRDDYDLTEYLLLANFPMVAQRLSVLPGEAGIFYVREPRSEHGFVFSITDKRFPFVIGDGRSRLGDLILADPRARLIASTYFARHRASLDDVPQAGVRLQLAECGNHCQGAIFLNGNHLITTALTTAIERAVAPLPHFYFGRLDVRFKDAESLRRGEDFEIVEINGAGSEATHIWDARTRLSDAYRTLWQQWRLLFAIGDQVKRRGLARRKVRLVHFL